eukprot:scaffold2615_cov151-Skeletonema_menzelii.AAC.4
MKRKPLERIVLILVAGIILVTLGIQTLNNYDPSIVTTSTKSSKCSMSRADENDFISAKTIQTNRTATGMPKLVWMYWDQGLAHLEELSKDDPPNRYAADFSCVKAMMEMNPSWNVMILNEESAKDYAPIFASVVCNETLYSMLGPTMKGDLLRLELLSRYGGVYADTSICPLKPFDDFITEWVGNETNGFFAQPSNLGNTKRLALSRVAFGNVPLCHDHSKIDNTGVRGKGSPFRTSSNWMLASTNPHNPLVDEWLYILHNHFLSLNAIPPYFIAHCALTQARLYNETVDAIWTSTMTRYGVGGKNTEMKACLGVMIKNGQSSNCAVVKRIPKMYVLSGNYSKRIHLASNDTTLHLPSPIEVTTEEPEEEEEYKSKSRRLEAMNATAGIFSYVHISKCSGSTWVTLLKKLNLRVFPQHRAGQEEFSVQFQRSKLGTKAAYHSTTLRSPRHHVLSMFLHCKYFKKGKQQFQWNGTDESDFEGWLDHHLPMGPHNRDMHRCFFHPANYQSRHLTSSSRRPHGLEGGEPFEPDVRAANRTYLDLDFVSLTEFVHESRCLLYYRLKRNTTPEALAYLDNNCRCDTPTHDGDTVKDNVHVSHHSGSHRSNMRDLPEDILLKVRDLTRIDVDIYNVALRQFMEEIAWLESKAALGRRVLCDDVLKHLEPELSYLPSADGKGTNVTKIYMEAIDRRNL